MFHQKMVEPSVVYRCRRWLTTTMFGLTAIGMLSTAIIASVAIVIVYSIDSGETDSQILAANSAAKNWAIIMICMSTGVTILVDVWSFTGSYKQSYYMTLTYTILLVVIIGGSCLISLQTSNWYTLILHLLVLGLAYDLRLLRNHAFVNYNSRRLADEEAAVASTSDQYRQQPSPQMIVQLVSCSEYTPTVLQSAPDYCRHFYTATAASTSPQSSPNWTTGNSGTSGSDSPYPNPSKPLWTS